MNEYPSKDIGLNVVAWNKIYNFWDKIGYDCVVRIIDTRNSDEYNRKVSNDVDNLIKERKQKCIKIHHNMVESMSSIVSDQWFKTEIGKQSSIPTIPMVIKKLIKQYAHTDSLHDDDNFKIRYDIKLQKL